MNPVAPVLGPGYTLVGVCRPLISTRDLLALVSTASPAAATSVGLRPSDRTAGVVEGEPSPLIVFIDSSQSESFKNRTDVTSTEEFVKSGIKPRRSEYGILILVVGSTDPVPSPVGSTKWISIPPEGSEVLDS